MARESKKVPEDTPIGMSSKLRKAYSWFEPLLETIKTTALNTRRKAARTGGPELAEEKLIELVDELEETQRQLNPLENRRKEIQQQLVAHWGHTGIEEIEGRLGKTRITPSFEMCFDQAKFKPQVEDSVWRQVTRRMVMPTYLLTKAADNYVLRALVVQSMKVRKVKVSVVPPSSRTAQSGEADEEQE